MPKKPVSVMPWHKPEPHKPLLMQDKAAFKQHLLDHNAAFDVDSPVSPIALCTIICTISDQCCEPDIVGEMIEHGMRVARFDMCHTTPLEQSILLKKFRSCVLEHSRKLERTCTVTIAVQLKGPAVLIGGLQENAEKIHIKSGDEIRLSTSRAYDDCGNKDRVYVDFDELTAVLQRGDTLLLDYGRIELRVRGVVDSDVVCDIINGGELVPYTEVTVLGVPINLGPITEKDVVDLNFALDSEVDAIIVPMVRLANSINEVKELIGDRGKEIALIAQVDSRQGYDQFNDILRVADGIVIHRGRLSIELSTEKVMQAQKSMVAKANKVGKPVYAVTEYLNSMIHKNSPTIAEATDVINAVIEGVDGIILQDETTIGDYPVLCVRTMTQLCKEAESQIWQSDLFNTLTDKASPPVDPAHAICIAAVEASFKVHAAAILIVTTSGKSGTLLARYKPRCPIMAITRYGCVARQMNLYKGILPVHVLTAPHPCWSKDVDLRMQQGIDVGKEIGIIKPGDPLILVNSWRPGAGFTNNIRIVYASIEDPWILPVTIDQDDL